MDNKEPMKSIEEYVNPENFKKPRTGNWAGFVESEVLNFFNRNQFEKMTLEDGNGNKAKLARQKDDNVKIETSSTTIV